MLFMKCPACNDEYTVIPVRNKTDSFVCQACGWQGGGFSPWGTIFDKDRWLESRQGVAAVLRDRIFISSGFPVDLLAGHVAYKDGVILIKGETAGKPLTVEYRAGGSGQTTPDWLRLGKDKIPLSALRRFRAWLHNEDRDAVYICDSFRKAIVIMESWWIAEGRLPDIVWVGAHGSTPMSTPPWMKGRHLLFVGAPSLVKSFRPSDCGSSAWLRTEGRNLPENIYLVCRKLEDAANDPGNYGHPVELRMDDFKWNSRGRRLDTIGLPGQSHWKELLEVQKKRLTPSGIPEAISHVPKLRPGEKKWNARTRKKRVQA